MSATTWLRGHAAIVLGGAAAAVALLGVLAIGVVLLPPGPAEPSSTPPASSTATGPAPDRRALA